MPIETFLNELSFFTQAVDLNQAQNRMGEFVNVLRNIIFRGGERKLNIYSGFYNIILGPNYSIMQWFSDDRVEKEARLYLRGIVDKGIIIDDMLSNMSDIECLVEGEKAVGVHGAYVREGLAISLPSRDIWNCHLLKVQIKEMEGEEIASRYDLLPHVSTIENIKGLKDWIYQNAFSTLKNYHQLWQTREKLFSRMLFCDAVEEQTRQMPMDSLGRIIKALNLLNIYALMYKPGQFDETKIGCDVSPESQETLRKYGEERTFLCPDGQYRVFSWHMKIGSFRVHFDFSYSDECILVGYIGRHLRTVKYKN